MIHKIHLPGQRILRTVLAVWLTIGIYFFVRGDAEASFLAVIAAIACIQPSLENTKTAIRGRVLGTLLGEAWGLVLLFFESAVFGDRIAEAVHLILTGLFVGLIIYICSLTGLFEHAFFSVVVYLVIALSHSEDVNPMIYVIIRLVDTLLGIAVGTFINALHFPRIRHKEILFVSGIGQVSEAEIHEYVGNQEQATHLQSILSHVRHPDAPVSVIEEHHLSPYARVELNRLIADGAKYTVASDQSPATIREVTNGIPLLYPVIAFGGAILYDMGNRKVLHAEKIREDLAEKVNRILREEGAQYVTAVLEDDLIELYYHDLPKGSLLTQHLKRHRSVYRNYVHTQREIREDVLHFFITGTVEETRALADRIASQPWAKDLRIQFDNFECGEDELHFRIYSARATRQRMFRRLKDELGIEKMIKFGHPEDGFDEVIPHHGVRAVKDIKNLFEPVDLRGWRNMLHL